MSARQFRNASMCLIALLWALTAHSAPGKELTIGSKRFTESVILAEIVRAVAATSGDGKPIIKKGLGNTAIVFSALKDGAIDIYPEYSGTIVEELLQSTDSQSLTDINKALEKNRITAGIPLGFSNSYALAVSADKSAELGLRSISDLVRQPGLKLGLSHEFLKREDGWRGLKSRYHLPYTSPLGYDHDLAYEALAAGQLDVIDVYTTDAKLSKYKLKILADDLGYFPKYDALLLYRSNVPADHPEAWKLIRQLQGAISNEEMIRMNAERDLSRLDETTIAAKFVEAKFGLQAKNQGRGERGNFWTELWAPDFGRLLGQHLYLVFVSLFFGIAAGVPLGIVAANNRRLTHPILSAVGLLQTIPSLALLAALIPLMHTVGAAPAIVALFLYSLLPIVRGAYTGLADIPPALKESAVSLGLPPAARLRLIELPLASRSILSGIKTSAVINVGTATIAAFIGAGGFGERIVSGLSTGDDAVLLAGAIPAAALALVVQGLFDTCDLILVPKALRKSK